jgi:GxxExxY protein
MDENQLSYSVIGAVIEVHKQLGPGLLEHVYEEALAIELEIRRIPFERQCQVPLRYKGRSLRGKLRVDFLVAGKLILELKAVEQMHEIFTAQLLTYLRLTGCKLGLLINFNVARAADGVNRVINHL